MHCIPFKSLIVCLGWTTEDPFAPSVCDSLSPLSFEQDLNALDFMPLSSELWRLTEEQEVRAFFGRLDLGRFAAGIIRAGFLSACFFPCLQFICVVGGVRGKPRPVAVVTVGL